MKQTDIHLFLSGSPKSVSFLGKRSSNGAHEKTGLKPVFDSSVVCCDVVRSKGSDRLLRLACRLPPRLPPGRLRTIRYSNVHRTFELRSCPHGFESLLFSYENKKTSKWMSFCFGAVEGIRTPMVSHTDLNRARLPIPPRPRIGCPKGIKYIRLPNIQYYTT